MLRIAFPFALIFALPAAAQLKSGPEEGQSVKSFSPHNVTGPDAGKTACLVCKNADNPVAAVFARGVDDNLTKLIARIDEVAAKNRKKEMGSFVVFLGRAAELERESVKLAEKLALKETVLAVDGPAGPKGYAIADDAWVTVLLYEGRRVVANFAFAKGTLAAADVDRIVNAIPRILEK